MIKQNTEIDMANVAFKSVLGTTRKYSIPINPAIPGRISTGNISMKFHKKTQQKIVNANGAIHLS